MDPVAKRRADLLGRYPTWPDCSIPVLFDSVADEFPDRPMALTPERSLSYREAQAQSRLIAAGLIARGLGAGDHVALVMANYPEFPLIKLAIARAGAVAVPINYLLQPDEMLYVLKQSQSRMLIGMDHFRGRDFSTEFAVLPGQAPGLDQIIVREAETGRLLVLPQLVELADSATSETQAECGRREALVRAGQVSDIVYTSGTTGYPKGALITHDMVLRAAFSSALTRSFEDGRRIQFALPMYHVFGYIECWVATLFVGGAIIPHAVFDAAEMLETGKRLGATDMICVPTMTQQLVDEARRTGFRSPTLRSVFNSGGYNVPTIWGEIRDVLGAEEIHTAYGMTETTASAMCTLTEDAEDRLIETNGRFKLAGPAGDPAIGNRVAEYRAVDPESGAILPPDLDGELQVRGPLVTKGYFAKPEETAQAFTPDGWFRTGDLGRLLEGGYLKLSGRIKETYRCGGEMVMPREIEDLLAGWPGVAQVLAVGIADPRMGEVGCLCVVAEPGAEPDLAAMLAACRERLARFKVPKHAIPMAGDEIPLTATGRPQKFRLAQIAAEHVARRMVA